MPPQVTRFAPSPTGRLHVGHAFSALLAWRLAQQSGGRFLLRIEDIDHTRCRPENTDAIFRDLAWLGLEWEEPVRIQSEHREDFQQALDGLSARGLVYPCFCTRKEIEAEIARSVRAPHGPEGPLYPGTCRRLGTEERLERLQRGDAHALRFDTQRALGETGALVWQELPEGEIIQALPEQLGDVVLGRKDIGTSYHLAVTVDDAQQGVTLVSRGTDLRESTHLHRLLQELLGLPVPTWLHHPLVTDEKGQRLAKRDQSITLEALREKDPSPNAILDRFEDWLHRSGMSSAMP